MSDQWRAGAVISLEEVFRSREFGRRPTRWDSAPVITVEATDPPLLEQVFLSDLFGHPEALVTPRPIGATPTASAPARPTLVLLAGRGEAERDLTRYRGAIGAVSGVAAAALVVAGMTTGTGSRPEQPTVSAEGKPPGPGSPAGSGGPLPGLTGPGGVSTQPSTSGQPPVATGSAGAAPLAQLASATTPAPAVVAVAAPAPAPVGVAPSPPAPGGGPAPTGPAPTGTGSVLTPVLATVGTTVSTVGTTVTAASNDLAQAVPAVSPVAGLLGNVGATVTNLGSSVAGA